MNPRTARLLTSLYPRAWRERYGAEFEALLQTGRGGLRTSVNVVWSALGEHMSQFEKHDPRSRQLRSWCVRAPWAIFSLAPLLLLAGAYFIACLYLWSGWEIFLPGADTPFGGSPRGPIYGIENIYFQAGKFYYFAAPVLVGWLIELIAARQKVKAAWPALGLVLIACMGAAAQVRASRTAVPRGFGHIRMDFVLGHSAQDISYGLLHASVIFSLTVLPWLIWRLQKANSLSA